MQSEKHKVFISFYHDNDQWAKDYLLALNFYYDIFFDRSVATDDISDDLTDETIRTKIRDEYLRDSSVTVLIVGTGTRYRKHIDWEIYSSMYDGSVNKRSGLVVIELPSTGPGLIEVCHDGEKSLYPGINWTNINSQSEYSQRHPYIPDRIVENLATGNSFISVTTWDAIKDNPQRLRNLIDMAYVDRQRAQYYLGTPMRRNNSNGFASLLGGSSASSLLFGNTTFRPTSS